MPSIIIISETGKEIARIPHEVIKRFSISEYGEKLHYEKDELKPFRMQINKTKDEVFVFDLMIVETHL